MKNYIQELGVVPSIAEPVVIFCDNNGAITQAKESRSHHRSKHILRHYHLLRNMVSRGDCRMDQVSSAKNTADPLTKPMSQLDRALDGGHEINCLGLGLKRSKSRTSRMGIESSVETCTKSVNPTELTRGDRHMEALEAWSSECVARTVNSKKRIRPLSLHDRGWEPTPNSCPRPRPRDDRWKDRTRTDPKPKRSRNNSPSLYMLWTVARRSPMVTGSPDQGLIKSY
ncbi:UNVERIFIED_CONTAM: hypothetical protein Slati_1331300 [Sesamum latifolium]|uniref:Uncharacterized protein n=1 Tax=Sesamum latifolium TaxID=2727402 RepID=A0AAW2XHM0_9LAMI